MVRDEIRDTLRRSRTSEAARDLQRGRLRRRSTRGCASIAQRCASTLPDPAGRAPCSCWSVPATSARASRPRSRALAELPRSRAPHRRRARKAHRSATRASRARSGVASRITFAGPQTDPKPYFGARRRLRPADDLRSVPERGARGHGLRAAGHHQHQVRRRRTRDRARRRASSAPSRDAAALAAHMRTLLDRRHARPAWAPTRDAAVEPLTPEAMTLKLVLLYKELLEASVARRRSPGAQRRAATTAAVASPRAKRRRCTARWTRNESLPRRRPRTTSRLCYNSARRDRQPSRPRAAPPSRRPRRPAASPA